MLIERGIGAQIRRGNLSHHERWEGVDCGLIAAWERGREFAVERPDLAEAAVSGQLIELPWKGGVTRVIKGRKFGSFLYLAMWQGLRGEPLCIDLCADLTLVCAAHRVSVTYTSDSSKYANAVS